MAEIHELLQSAIERGGSDVFIIPGSCVRLKVAGEVQPLLDAVLKPDDTKRLIQQVYDLDRRPMDRLTQSGDDDFSFSVSGVGRFRCNAYQQRNSFAMVLRVVSLSLPDPVQMHIPDEILRLADIKKGLVLVTGPAASGKSTTLACIIDRINTNRHGHIITIEDPIEFIHAHKASVLSQRESEHDTHREHLEKVGFVQQARAASVPPAETAPKPTPAQVRSSQAPGAAPAAPANEPGGSILGVLGI